MLGIGAQGGDLALACNAGLNANGMGLLIPISRGISAATDPAAAAIQYRDQINAARVAAAATAATSKQVQSGVHYCACVICCDTTLFIAVLS
jgi:uridine monophosphate synthetase